jgi:hypothetical protein
MNQCLLIDLEFHSALLLISILKFLMEFYPVNFPNLRLQLNLFEKANFNSLHQGLLLCFQCRGHGH